MNQSGPVAFTPSGHPIESPSPSRIKIRCERTDSEGFPNRHKERFRHHHVLRSFSFVQGNSANIIATNAIKKNGRNDSPILQGYGDTIAVFVTNRVETGRYPVFRTSTRTPTRSPLLRVGFVPVAVVLPAAIGTIEVW